MNTCSLVCPLPLLAEIHAETFLIDQHTVLELCYFLFLLLLLTAIDTIAKSHLIRACLPILVVVPL